MTYAADTTVSVVRSRTEIEELLRKHGATAIASGWEDGQSVIQCRIYGRILRFSVRLPLRSEHRQTATGRVRTTAQVDQAVGWTG